MSTSVAVIGECMLELTHADTQSTGMALPMAMNYGGDTINTSIYLSRNDVSVSYITGLGDDTMSDWLLGEWSKEGVDCSLVARMPDSVPGMYMINVDDQGERSFLYWRKGSPASRLFNDANYVEKLFQAIADFDYLYLSGISLAILPEDALFRLFDHLGGFRERGGKVIFDGNYRPTLWSNISVARQAYQTMYRLTDIALPTFEDEAMLFGHTKVEEVVESVNSFGVAEIIVKMGADGCLAFFNNSSEFVAARSVTAIDTTAAGDSFNAGYLSARFNDKSVIESCQSGHDLASKVIQHKGAIIPQ